MNLPAGTARYEQSETMGDFIDGCDDTITAKDPAQEIPFNLWCNARDRQARAPKETQADNVLPAFDDKEQLQRQPFAALGGKESELEIDDNPPCYECCKYGHRARDHRGSLTTHRRKHWEAHRASWHGIMGMRLLGLETPAIAQAGDVPRNQVSKPRDKDTLASIMLVRDNTGRNRLLCKVAAPWRRE